MRGTCRMTFDEMEKWTKEFELSIQKINEDKSYVENLTRLDLCPYNICRIMEKLGWFLHHYTGPHDWEQDYFYYYTNPNYNFVLIFYYCGQSFRMELRSM